jgi:hypothetical protein
MTHPTTTPTTTFEPMVVLATANPALGAALTAIEPRASIVALDPVYGLDAEDSTVIPARAGLLLLVPAAGEAVPALEAARALYVTDDLDDATVWARAVAWRAAHVVVLPDGLAWLTAEVHTHMGR